MPRTLRRASAGRLQDIALEELTVGQPKPVYHQDSIPRGADVRPLKDGWWIAKIVIRSFSLVFATALVILELVLLTDGGFYWGNTNTEFLACIIPVRCCLISIDAFIRLSCHVVVKASVTGPLLTQYAVCCHHPMGLFRIHHAMLS